MEADVFHHLIDRLRQGTCMCRWEESALARLSMTSPEHIGEVEPQDLAVMTRAIIGRFLFWFWTACTSQFHVVLDPARGVPPLTIDAINNDDPITAAVFMGHHRIPTPVLAQAMLDAVVWAVVEGGIFREPVVISMRNRTDEFVYAMQAHEGGLVAINLIQFGEVPVVDRDRFLASIAERPVDFMRALRASVQGAPERVPVSDLVRAAFDRAQSFGLALARRWASWSPSGVTLAPEMADALPSWRAELNADLIAECRAAFTSVIVGFIWDASVSGATESPVAARFRRASDGWYQLVLQPRPHSRLAERDRTFSDGLAVITIYELMHGLVTRRRGEMNSKHVQFMVQALTEALADQVLELDGLTAVVDAEGVITLTLDPERSW